MVYHLTTRRLDLLTPDERSRLNLLTLKGSVAEDGEHWYSAMREDILHREDNLEQVQLFLIRDQTGTIVAWSSAMPSPRNCFPGQKHAFIYTYVMRAHRRNKLGTRLINRAVAWCKNQNLTPRVIHTSQNTSFFKTVRHQMKPDVAGY